jgi:hypothetical protein
MIREIRIFIEGGGQSRESKIAIRQGFSEFLSSLRTLATSRGIGWKVIPCGSRLTTFQDFEVALRTYPDAFNVLLVDSEEPVKMSVWKHLELLDRWRIPGLPEEHGHLMAQTIEAWLVADPEALAEFYGQAFHRKALPVRQDVEQVDKKGLLDSLKKATGKTRKGTYHKVEHCSQLLARIDPARVRTRAKHCDRLFTTLTEIIERR